MRVINIRSSPWRYCRRIVGEPCLRIFIDTIAKECISPFVVTHWSVLKGKSHRADCQLEVLLHTTIEVQTTTFQCVHNKRYSYKRYLNKLQTLGHSQWYTIVDRCVYYTIGAATFISFFFNNKRQHRCKPFKLHHVATHIHIWLGKKIIKVVTQL